MKPKIAPVQNIARLDRSFNEARNRDAGSPGMILVYGATGAGKTTAVAHLMNETGSIYVAASPAWSLMSMYRAIAFAAGVETNGRAADIERRIITEMTLKDRPLILDELDYLLMPGAVTTLRMLEALRSIHDQSGLPVVMVGMDRIDRKIKLREQLARRVYGWVEFADLDMDDMRKVADTCFALPVADDYLEALHQAVKGRISYVTQNIAAAERRGKAQRWTEINLARHGKEPFITSR